MPYPDYEIGITDAQLLRFIYFDDLFVAKNSHVWRFKPDKGQDLDDIDFEAEITSLTAGGSQYAFGLANGEISFYDDLRELRDKRIKCCDCAVTALLFNNADIVAGDREGNIHFFSGENHSQHKTIKLVDSPIKHLEGFNEYILALPTREPRLIVIDDRHEVTQVEVDYSITDISTGYRDEWFYTGDTNGVLMRWGYPEMMPVDAAYADSSPITGVEVIFDRPQIWTGHMDGKVKIFNLETHEELATVQAHEKPVQLAYTPYNTYLLSASEDKKIQMWMLENQFDEPEKPQEPENKAEPLLEYLIPAVELIDRYDPSGTLSTTIKDSSQRDQPILAGTALLNMATKLYNEDKSIGHILDVTTGIFKEINAYEKLGDIALMRGNMVNYINDEKSEPHYAEAIKYYRESDATRKLVEALIKHGGVSQRLDRIDQVYEDYMDAIDIAGNNGYNLLKAEAMKELAGVLKDIEYYDQAETMLDQAYPLAEKEDNSLAGRILLERAQIAFGQKQNQKAVQYYKRAYDHLSETGEDFYLGVACMGIGYALLNLERNSEAEASLRKSIEHLDRQDNEFVHNTAYKGLSVALDRQGKTDEALEIMRKAKEYE